MIEVKLVPVMVTKPNRRKRTEEELAQLVNAGWVIVAAGAAFVVLQRGQTGN
jgi:hypothetical protein